MLLQCYSDRNTVDMVTNKMMNLFVVQLPLRRRGSSSITWCGIINVLDILADIIPRKDELKLCRFILVLFYHPSDRNVVNESYTMPQSVANQQRPTSLLILVATRIAAVLAGVSSTLKYL